jgi:hypothetical protein
VVSRQHALASIVSLAPPLPPLPGTPTAASEARFKRRGTVDFESDFDGAHMHGAHIEN